MVLPRIYCGMPSYFCRASQASRVIHVGPRRMFSSSAPADPYKQAHGEASHVATDAVAACPVERVFGRVCRLERGGNVVAVSGGREIVIEGVEVRDALLTLQIAFHNPQVIVCATGYDYSFPFLKCSDDFCCDAGCLADGVRGVHMRWDRNVVEPL